MAATPKLDVADAAHQLAAALAAETGQVVAEIRAFADEYAPDYAEVAASIATAKLARDADALADAEDELRTLNDVALLDAAIAGVGVQAAGETAVTNVLNRVAAALVAHLLG